MRYSAENSGAVLDQKTGLREWFGSHLEAIEIARQRNGQPTMAKRMRFAERSERLERGE